MNSLFPNMPARKRVLGALLTGSALLMTAACGSTATVEAAPDAADPDCAEVMLALPDAIGDHDRRQTDSQGTAVWGDPMAVIARCGVTPPGPSTEHCVSADGIDWLSVEEDGNWRLTSYGREPAVEVILDIEQVASSTAMMAMSGAVGNLEQTRECTSVEQEIEETGDEVDVAAKALSPEKEGLQLSKALSAVRPGVPAPAPAAR